MTRKNDSETQATVICAPMQARSLSSVAANGALKAALLYFDDVSVLTPAALQAAHVRSLLQLDDEQLVRAVLADKVMAPRDSLVNLFWRTLLDGVPDDIRRKLESQGITAPPNDETAADRRARLTEAVPVLREAHRIFLDRLEASTETSELFDAESNGLLHIVRPENPTGDLIGAMTSFFMALRSVCATARSALVIDDNVKEILSSNAMAYPSMVPEGFTEGAVVQQVFGSLPTLPSATIEEIVQVKTRFQSDLRRFHAMVIDGLRDLPDVTDPSFALRSDQWWRRAVLPEVEIVRTRLSEASSWRHVGTAFLTDQRGLVTVGGLLLAEASGAVVGASKLESLALGISYMTASAIAQARKARHAAQANAVCFYVRAVDALSSGVSSRSSSE